MPVPAFDLALDTPDDAVVRKIWDRLADVGADSETRRTGSSHRPHLTLAESELLPTDAVHERGRGLTDLLPVRMTVGSVAVLGGRRPTVVYLLNPVPRVRDRVAELRAGLGLHSPWLPHLTLARRVPIELLPAALETAVEARPATLTFATIRLWLPASGHLNEWSAPPR